MLKVKKISKHHSITPPPPPSFCVFQVYILFHNYVQIRYTLMVPSSLAKGDEPL